MQQQRCNANENDAMQCMTSLLPICPKERERGLQPKCSSMCVAVPVLTAPIRLRFLQMHINGESANANVAMYSLRKCCNVFTSHTSYIPHTL
jgi:hypothetical protein